VRGNFCTPLLESRKRNVDSHDLEAVVRASEYTNKMRTLPNIIVAGTPGVGKTTTITQLLSLVSTTTSTPLKHLSINDIVKSRNCHSGYDEDLQTLIVDEDKLMDEIEKEIGDGEGEGGWIIDWHSTEGFAVRWVDLVVVLRCEDTAVLFDRLKGRGYKDNKIQDNMDAEIFGVVAEEAKEGWAEDGQVLELKSVEVEDIEENAERILGWVQNWIKDHAGDG
jgi:broad-specificity NMP kinase